MNIKYITIVAFLIFTCIAVYSLLTSVTVEPDKAYYISADSLLLPDPPEVKKEYGLPVDSFVIHRGQIKSNQFLADILLKHHVPYPEIDKLVKSADGTFNVRAIRAGGKYAVFCSRDSVNKAHYFIYEPSDLEYVVFCLKDSFQVHRELRKIETREKTAAGVIHSSLYKTLQENNISPVLAMELSEIFAWSIDFYRIQKGDRFKVIYEEKLVEGIPIGIGRIKAALFEHWGEDHYAFYFEQNELDDYFDEEANSLRKAFLQAPLKFSRISSGFTMKRFHPVQKRWKAHLGTDYAAPRGTPIMAVGDGIIEKAAYAKFNGNYVKIKHNGTYSTQYLHMSKIASGMKPGKKVRQGDVIGYVGSTGLATGPHVCFRFWKNGKQVNHRKEKFPPSKPVEEKHLPKYRQVMEEMKKRLSEIGEEQMPV